jgi:ElaA protein
MSVKMQFIEKTFNQLSPIELYHLLKLRVDVFVVEQNCAYQELDGLDLDNQTSHLIGYDGDDIVAYARVLAPGICYGNSAAIGRVIIANSHRGKGFAKELVNKAIKLSRHHWPVQGIEISAQCYLIEFYQSLGFNTVGEEYLEDDIPHIHMVLG